MDYIYEEGMSLEDFIRANNLSALTDKDFAEIEKAYDAARGADTRDSGRGDVNRGPRDAPERPDGTGGAGDARGQLQALLDKLNNPAFGADFYARLAKDATPDADQFLKQVNATGGSTVQANEQFEAAQRAAQGDAFNAFGQFKLGTDQLQAGIAGDLLSNEEFLAGLAFQGEQAGKDRTASFWNSLLSGVLGIGGIYLGNKLGGGTNNTYPNYGGSYSNPFGGAGVGTFGGGGGYPTIGLNLSQQNTTSALPSSTPASVQTGGTFGGTQQAGRQSMRRPPGRKPSGYEPFGF